MIASARDNEYDVIIIGSGMGGLTTGSLLAQVGKMRVLVLESHFKLGGFLHSFRRGKYVWDPGVHYVGEMQEGSLTRRCMDLVTGGKVSWNAIQAPYERFVFPGESFDVPPNATDFQQRLIERFPAEAKAIQRYFRDVKSVQGWSHRWFFAKQLSPAASRVVSAGRGLALQTTQAYLDERFRDPLLKSILTAQWPDYGTIPEQSAFGIHAIVAGDFLNGGYYPVGGSQAIADSAAEMIEQHGGKCLVSHPVKRIIVENRKAIGVVAIRKGVEIVFKAKHIISAAGIQTTFCKLLAEEEGRRERERIVRFQKGTSATILFLGLKDDPRKYGFDDRNYWVYPRVNHNESLAKDSSQLPRPVEGGFLSFGSLRNPGQEPHTAQIVTFSREEEWRDFADQPWMKRGDCYEQLKARRSEDMLDLIEQHVGPIRHLIDYQELSSPLTVNSFTGHAHGQIYGRECTPSRLSETDFNIGTSIKNLYLTGTDITVPGVNSALMIGVMTAGKVLGWLGMPRIMSRAFRGPTRSE